MGSTDATSVTADLGLRCPRCSSAWSHVLNTRRLTTGQVRRYRQCHHCQTRFTTLELTLPDLAGHRRR